MKTINGFLLAAALGIAWLVGRDVGFGLHMPLAVVAGLCIGLMMWISADE